MFHTLIVHLDNGVPLQCEDRYVNPACAPGYLGVDFTRTTPTHYLLEVAPLWEAQYTIEAGAPTRRRRGCSASRRDEPCLVVVRRTVSRGMPITLARLVHPGLALPVAGRIPAMSESLEQRVARCVTPALVEAYQRDGAVCLRQVLTPAEVALLREGIDRNLAAPSPRAIVASQPDDPGYFVEDFCNWQDNDAYRRVIFESALARAAAALMRSADRAAVSRSHADQGTRNAPAHAVAPGPAVLQRRWPPERQHVDSGRSGAAPLHARTGRRLASRPVADAAYVHGSPGEVVSGRPLAELPDIDHRRDEYTILGWELEPGDLVCFHMLSLHAAAVWITTGAAVCSRCVSSATTSRMRRASGPRRRRLRGWSTNSPPVRR